MIVQMMLMLLTCLGVVANAFLNTFCQTVLFCNSLLCEHSLIKLFHALSMLKALHYAFGIFSLYYR